MSEIILELSCQGMGCNDKDLKRWICGRCHSGDLLLMRNGTAKCNKCDFQKDLLSIDFLCNKCEKKNDTISIEQKYQSLLSQIQCLYGRDGFETVISLRNQIRKYI